MRNIRSLSSLLASTAFTATLALSSLIPGRVNALSSGILITLTNAQRNAAGLNSLTYNSKLANAAASKAAHMCSYNYWAHTAPDGTTGWTFIRQAGYSYATAGENLAKGFDSDQTIIDSWMASPTHKTNILQAAYKEIGIGSYQCGTTVYDTIVVAIYATQATPATKPLAAQAPAHTPEQVQPVNQSIQVTAEVLATPENTPASSNLLAISIKKDHKDMNFIDLVINKIKKLFASEIQDMLTAIKSA